MLLAHFSRRKGSTHEETKERHGCRGSQGHVGCQTPPVKAPEHVHLRPQDQPFWLAVVGARARDEWCVFDLTIAAHLARTMSDVEQEAKLLDAEGLISDGRVNPRATVLDLLSKRQMALARSLRLCGRIAGDVRNEIGRRRLERHAARVAAETEDDDDWRSELLAH